MATKVGEPKGSFLKTVGSRERRTRGEGHSSRGVDEASGHGVRRRRTSEPSHRARFVTVGQTSVHEKNVRASSSAGHRSVSEKKNLLAPHRTKHRNLSTLALFGGPKARTKPFPPHPVLGKEEKREVLSVLKTGVLSGFVATPGDAFLGGPKAKELERLFCGYFGARHAVAMNSATSALHAALLAVGVEPGDEVIVSPYSMVASASAIVMCGGIPVFTDIENSNFCIDPDEIETKITPRTKAIVVVHLFGHPASMAKIMALAKKYRLKVVEDCAQAPGAAIGKRLAGTFGDIGVFSLNQHKTITAGEGGIAVTNDKALAFKLQLVRNHGEVVIGKMKGVKPVACLGWNYRMTEMEAAVGIAQFKKLDRLTGHRIKLARYLTKKLQKFNGLRLPIPSKNHEHVYFVYPIVYDAARTGVPRDVFVKALGAEGIPFGAGYVRPIYLEPMYQQRRIFERSRFPFDLARDFDFANYCKGSCPNAEYFYEKALISTALCRWPLTALDIDDVARAFAKIYANLGELRGVRP